MKIREWLLLKKSLKILLFSDSHNTENHCDGHAFSVPGRDGTLVDHAHGSQPPTSKGPWAVAG